MLILVFACSGATCNWRQRSPLASTGPPAPQVLSPTATAPQIVEVVNQNTARIRTYVTNNASITVPGALGLPLLRGNLAVERPRRVRLRAGTALTGDEVDLGSNDELYWLWSKRNNPPAVLFARHADHRGSAAQQHLPIDPEWLLDALGLITLDPNAAYQGPLARPDGTLELRVTENSTLGPRQRVFVIDQTRGWVLEQHAYDTAGALLASATASDFRFDPLSQSSLPRRVTIQVPSADLSLSINTGGVVVNSQVSNPGELFGMPSFAGTPQVDLGRSDALPPLATAVPTTPPAVQPVVQQVVQQAAFFDPVANDATENLSVPRGSLPGSTPQLGQLPSGGITLQR